MRPVSMPMPRVNASWSQPGGLPSNNPGHLALSSRDQFRSLIDRFDCSAQIVALIARFAFFRGAYSMFIARP
jgi:hypothetical protein